MITDFIVSLTGPFVGVISAFAINHVYGEWRNTRKRSKYRNLFRYEIDNSIKLLKEGKLKLIPNSAWRLAVSSGDLSLFSFDQAKELGEVYFAVDNYIYEAKRSRDMGERFRAEGQPNAKQEVQRAWEHVSVLASKCADELLRLLEALSKRDWLRDC